MLSSSHSNHIPYVPCDRVLALLSTLDRIHLTISRHFYQNCVCLSTGAAPSCVDGFMGAFSQCPTQSVNSVHSCSEPRRSRDRSHWWSSRSAVTLHSALLQFHLHNPHTAECLSVIKPSWIEPKLKEIHLLHPAGFSYSVPPPPHPPNLLFQLFSGQNMEDETHKRIYLH